MLILATYKNGASVVNDLYDCKPSILKKDFLGVPGVSFFLFHIYGKNYQERKAAAADLAMFWSNYRHNISNLSYSEEATIQSYFENLALKYGLLQEYRENLII